MNLLYPDFDEEKHCYTIDGRPAPGVTSIISSALGVNPFFTEAGRKFGTAVHKAIHYYSEGDLDFDSLADPIKPRLEAYIRFCDDLQFRSDMTETALGHPVLKYCGMPDQIKFGNMVIDYKNGDKRPEYALQLAAYANLLPNPHIYERIALLLLPTGKYKIEYYRRQDMAADFNIFISMLNIKNWRQTNGIK